MASTDFGASWAGTDPLDSVLAVPWSVVAYERWLREQPSGARAYLFAEPIARFELRDTDCLRAAPGLVVISKRRGYSVSLPDAGFTTDVEGDGGDLAESWLAQMDGTTPLVAIRARAAGKLPALRRFLDRTFGSVVFAPHAVMALERRLSASEITRFPGAPYQVVRSYWENMASVADLLRERMAAVSLGDLPEFVRLIRTAHVALLMGSDGENYYKPASPMSDQLVAPGAFLTRAPQLVEHGTEVFFVSGPRVSATLIGGAAYHALLYDAAGDPDALMDRTVDDAGVPWGRVVTARAEKDAEPAAWFCPPRPLGEKHLQLVLDALVAALRAQDAKLNTDVVEALAHFHWRFVRLHPFHCANQSLAMSFVNAVLRETQGAGIPHLILDLLALRMDLPAYAKVFGLAVKGYCVATTDPVERVTTLAKRIAESNALVSKLAAASDLASARGIAAQVDAELALIVGADAR